MHRGKGGIGVGDPGLWAKALEMTLMWVYFNYQALMFEETCPCTLV